MVILNPQTKRHVTQRMRNVAPRLPVAPASMGSSSSGFLPGGRTGVRTGLQGVRGPLGAGASIESGVSSNAKGSMMINNTTVNCIVYLQMYRFKSIYYSRTLSNAPLLETESTRLHYITFTIANPHSFTTLLTHPLLQLLYPAN